MATGAAEEAGVPIDMRCGCGRLLKAPDALAGKSVKCPACGRVLEVPAVQSTGAGPRRVGYGRAMTHATGARSAVRKAGQGVSPVCV